MQAFDAAGIMPSHAFHRCLAKENIMKKTALLAALLGAAAFLATAVQAQTQAPAPAAVQSKGAFFGVGVMAVNSEVGNNIASAFAGSSTENQSTGYKMYGGYMWGNWGVELGYYDLGLFEVKMAGATSDKFESQAGTLSAFYAAPFAGSGVIFLKAGAAYISADYSCVSLCGAPFTNSEKNSTSLLTGIGVGWRLTPGIMLRGDIERFHDVKYTVGTAGEFKGPIDVVELGMHFTF
jgi:opacity protein-like surface antigen